MSSPLYYVWSYYISGPVVSCRTHSYTTGHNLDSSWYALSASIHKTSEDCFWRLLELNIKQVI